MLEDHVHAVAVMIAGIPCPPASLENSEKIQNFHVAIVAKFSDFFLGADRALYYHLFIFI